MAELFIREAEIFARSYTDLALDVMIIFADTKSNKI
jgi:hypothetical protein